MPERIFQSTMRRTVTPMDLSPVNVYTTDITLDGGHGTVVADTTAGDITITLPQAALAPGQLYLVHKKVAAGVVTIEPTSPDVINYQNFASITLSAIDEEVSLVSAGTENVWFACSCSGEVTPGMVDGAIVTRIMSAAASFAVGPTTQYVMLGTCSSPAVGKATIGDAQLRAPRAMTLRAIYVRLGTVLAGDDTLTCKANINGTASSTITVTHNSGTGNLASATGTLAVAQDDLLCYEFAFGGGLASADINAITLSYGVLPE